MIVIHDLITGRIRGTVVCPEEWYELQLLEGEDYVESNINQDDFDINLYRIVDGEIVEKSPMSFSIDKSQIYADGVDIAAITGVPSGAIIRCKDTEQIADGTDVEFVTDIIGEHKLQITLWPYQDAEVIINAI